MDTAVDWESFVRMESCLVCDQDGQEIRWEIATMVQEMNKNVRVLLKEA